MGTNNGAMGTNDGAIGTHSGAIDIHSGPIDIHSGAIDQGRGPRSKPAPGTEPSGRTLTTHPQDVMATMVTPESFPAEVGS